MKRNLMLISGQSKLLTELNDALRRFKMEVIHIDDVNEVKAGLRTHSPAFLLLDYDIKGVDSLLADITSGYHASQPYIMIASTYSNGNERAVMLDRGADSCVDKPIIAHEIIAVINSVVRRCNRKPIIEYKDMTIHLEHRMVTMRGVPVDLTHKEYEVLCFLASHAGKVMTKEQIHYAVWKSAYNPKSTNVSDQISSL